VDSNTISAGRLADKVNKGELKALELIEKVLQDAQEQNEKLNIFCSIAGEVTLAQAAAVDQKIKTGVCLPLAGVPLTIKDDFMYKALPTTLGSPQFKSFYPPYNAAAVEKLIAAGAVVVGKTNTDNMGIGSTTLDSPQGPTLNPHDPGKVAGSAGAAALATGICSLALESDSGGALRQGAAYCGVFGLLPSVGMVSRHGLALHSGSFCRAGISALHPEDLPVALRVISGFDPRDAVTAVNRETNGKREKTDDLSTLKIGYSEMFPGSAADPRSRNFFEARDLIASSGASLAEVRLKHLPEALRAYQVIAAAEASSTLLRYDGIRYGQAIEADDLETLYCKTRRATFKGEALNRSIFGTYFLSKGGYDRYYRQALKVWSLIRQELETLFEQCDLLLTPVVQTGAPSAVEVPTFAELYENDLYTVPASMAGNPAVCLPADVIDGMPVGVQLIGKQFEDAFLLSAALKIASIIDSNLQGLAGGGS
jgi:aspartyl-tRNA(Asn)/glutamyl-tRNA(Gln) amidotransferase subunit A